MNSSKELENAIRDGETSRIVELLGVGKLMSPLRTAALLRIAVMHAAAETVALLFDLLEAKPDAGLLDAACGRGDTKVIGELLRRGADVQAKEGSDSAICMAAQGGHSAAVSMLLAAGADVDGRAPGEALFFVRESPLHRACLYEHLSVIDVLLDAGATVNARAVYGSTPLAYAAMRGSYAAVRRLLLAGAETSLENNNAGKIALGRISRNDARIAALLLAVRPEDACAIDKAGNAPPVPQFRLVYRDIAAAAAALASPRRVHAVIAWERAHVHLRPPRAAADISADGGAPPRVQFS